MATKRKRGSGPPNFPFKPGWFYRDPYGLWKNPLFYNCVGSHPSPKKNYTLLLNKLLRYGFRGCCSAATKSNSPTNWMANRPENHLFWKGKTPSKSPSLGSMTVSGVVTTLQGTSISPLKVAGKMIFFLHRLEMLVPTGVSFFFDKISSGISQCWGTEYHFGSLGSQVRSTKVTWVQVKGARSIDRSSDNVGIFMAIMMEWLLNLKQFTEVTSHHCNPGN